MKILYDYQILITQRYGGISRYFYELQSKINQKKGIKTKTLCVGSINAYFEDYFHKKPQKKLKKGVGKINMLLTSLVCNQYDIVHPTYYNPYLLNKYNGKIVITVYDMIHELLSQYFAEDDETAEQKKRMIYEADHIIAISQSTKNDILKLYPDIPEKKISVIYIGSNMDNFDGEYTDRDILPERYILFVGVRGKYKNFETFFKGIYPILKEDKDLKLVCLGGNSFEKEEIALLGDVRDQVKQYDVNDQLLAAAYKNAICFVFPSLYEGFGIPTLEAFYCNCPVVLSNTSSMPEVGGDAVVYIDPYDVADIEHKVRNVLTDEKLRSDLISKGRKQLEKFDWATIADQTIECYQEVLKAK